MTKLTIVILAGSMLLAGVPLVFADETHADCEADQPWMGYTSTEVLRDLVNELTDGTGVAITNCEGEQWDGQDSVSDYHPATEPCAADQQLTDTHHPAVDDCMGTNPNDGTSNPLQGAIVPVRLRVTGDNEGTDSQQYYAGLQIGAVGWAVVYLGECNGGSGLEGASSCGGSHEARQGAYVRDDTPGNVLAQAVSAPGITKGYVSEGDCDQATYQAGAESGDRTQCGRDNTAVGVNEILA